MAGDVAAKRWIDAGLFDPTMDGAEERLEVLLWLEEMGVDPNDFVGTDPDELTRVVANRFQRPGLRFDAAEARAQLELSPEDFERLCRASGYGGDEEFTELDLEAFSAFGAAVELFSKDELLHFSRVLAFAMGRVADAASSLFRVDVGAPLEASGGTELEWVKANHEVSLLIGSIYVPMQAFLLRQLEVATLRSDLGRQQVSSTASATTLKLAVGFVDLVGYTPIAAALAPDDLAKLMRSFEERAYDTVSQLKGKVVKLIGDEVMFVAADPADACAISRQLLDAFDDVAATPCGGVAYGEVVALGGDYYGSVVNLASRITDAAVPGEVLVDEAVAQAAATDRFEPAGRRQLKGFAEPVTLLSLRG